MDIGVKIINAFVDGDAGGNPAGVVIDADGLTSAQKQTVARMVAISETAFVSASTVADFKLEFFTPTRQIAHCGHATIATFSYLKQLGKVTGAESSKETIDGTRRILFRGDEAYMEQAGPSYSVADQDAESLCHSLGVSSPALLEGHEPTIVNTGNGFLLVPLRDGSLLAGLSPDQEMIRRISEKYDLIGYYAFALDTVLPGRDATARMFAPYYGIPEESATGMAAGPLAAYLYDRLGVRRERFAIEQGHFMAPPSPSLIHVELSLKTGAIESLMAGGKASVMKEITARV